MSARLQSLRPFLETPDLASTIAYWTGGLGFTVTNRLDDDRGRPLWCNIERDGVNIMFNSHYHDDPDEDGDESHAAALTGNLYINVDDVDALADSLGPDVDVLHGPEDQPHGMRELVVRDNNGYVVVFGKPVP